MITFRRIFGALSLLALAVQEIQTPGLLPPGQLVTILYFQL